MTFLIALTYFSAGVFFATIALFSSILIFISVKLAGKYTFKKISSFQKTMQ